jgi:predicted Zn finger-like uncharacterized protein
MSIATKCSHCGASYNLNDGMAGKKVRCKSCQETFLVPAGGAAKPAAKAGNGSKPGNGSQKIQPATRPVKAGATPPPPTKNDDPDAKPVKKAAPKKKSSTGKVLLIVGGIGAALLLVCCGVPTGLAFFGVFSLQSKVNNDIKQGQVDWDKVDKEFEKAIKEQQKAMGNNPGIPGPGNPGPGNAGPGNPGPGGDKNPMAGNPPVKVEFPQGLGPKEPASVADALNDLRGSDSARREAAARWLAKQQVDPAQQAEVSKALEAMLNDRNGGASFNVLSALKTWGTKDNVSALVKILDGKRAGDPRDVQSTQEVMDTLARFPDERGAEAVARFLPDFFTQEAATKSLETMGPVAEKAVLKYYNHHDVGTRDRVRKLLQGYGTKDVAIVLQCAADMHSAKAETRRLAADWLAQAKSDAQLQAQVAKDLEANLKDRDWEARQKTVRALGVWGGADNVPALVEMVEDPAPENGGARLEAITVLGKLKDEHAVPALIKCLDKNWERERAEQALLAIGAPAEKELLKYVGDPASERGGVMEAQKVLRGMGSKSNAEITLALTDLKSSNAGRRQGAAHRLAEMPSPDKSAQADVAKALADTLDDPEAGPRQEAAKALITWATPDVVPALLKAIDSEDVWVRHRSMEALGRLKEEKAAAPIASHLTKNDDRQAASKALQLMVGTKAEEQIFQYLVNPEHNVRLEACRILQAIGTKQKSLKRLEVIVQTYARTDKEVADAAYNAGREIGKR